MQNAPVNFVDTEKNIIHFERRLNDCTLIAIFNFDNNDYIYKNQKDNNLILSNGIRNSDKEIAVESSGYLIFKK